MTITRNNDGQITFDAVNTNTQLTTEQVQDIVGNMFSSNTETRITATYQDSDGTIDLVVDDMTANTDNYVNSVSFSSGTLTLGRTGSLSNLTTTIPLSGITGNFTDLDDTPSSYSGHNNKVVVVNSSANGLTFTTASSVGTDTNYYLSGLSFNTGNGVLTATVTGAANQTVDLDGRYVLQSTGGDSGVPSGVILLWSGSSASIPTGWYLCDGNNSTPDLRNRFVVGASDSVGDNTYPGLSPNSTPGGSADSTLVSHSHSINNHTHTFSTTSNPGNHFHYTMYAGGQNGTNGTGGTGRLHNRAGDNVAAVTSSYSTGSDPRQDAEIGARSGNAADAGRSSNAGGHTHSGTTGNPSNTGTNNQGSSGTNANLPPYYALCYIMKS